MDTNIQGCLAEYKFATMCMEFNLRVSFPLLDSSPYDCIVDTKKGLKKVQIKSVAIDGEIVKCDIRQNYKPYSKNDVDFFAIWIKSHDGFYIVENCGKKRYVCLSKKNKYSKYFNNFALL